MKLNNFKYFKLCILFIAVFVLVPAKVYATSIPQPTQEFYVNDFADVLTDEEEKQMLEKAVNLASEDLGIQVVVTTIKSLSGESIEQYAHDMYNQYGIGKDDMGVLILLATEDRDTRIELGVAMEAYITDSKAGRLLDKYAIPDFKENRFNSGLVSLQDAVIKEASTIKTQMEENALREAQRQESLEKIGNFFKGLLKGIGLLLLFGTPLGLLVYLIYRLYLRHKEREAEIKALREFKSEAQETIEKLIRERDYARNDAEDQERILNSRIKDLEQENNALERKFEDAERIYPSLEEEIDRSYVKDINEDIEEYMGMSPSVSIIPGLSSITSSYNRLTNNQKKYVSSNYSQVQKLLNESVEIERENLRKSKNDLMIKSILGVLAAVSIGKASNLGSLREAMNKYNELDEDFKEKLSSEELSKLKTYLAQAKKDKERIEREEEEEERRRRKKREEEEEERRRRREEDEEARRRRQRMNSYHSSSSSSSFHGFGGRSGGGGASRHF